MRGCEGVGIDEENKIVNKNRHIVRDSHESIDGRRGQHLRTSRPMGKNQYRLDGHILNI